MKQVKIIPVERIVEICDFCGELSVCKCVICKRDLCHKHCLDDSSFDGIDSYCPDCYDIGENYLEQISILYFNTIKDIDALREEWKKTALENLHGSQKV